MTNEIVLITGAANGIGRSITYYLLAKGDTVIATDVDENGLKRFAGSEDIYPFLMDVTNPKSIESTLNRVKDKFAHISCIVNNAGIFIGGPIVELDLPDLEKLLDINLMGYIRVVQAFYPLLRKGSRIINISSEAARISWPFNGPYGISKCAVEGFSDSLRRELMFKDIKVIKIQPGSINTQMMDCTKAEYKKSCEGSDFEQQMNRVFEVLNNEGCADPIYMAETVYRAIHNKRTKLVYRVKNNKLRRLSEFLPARWLDLIMKIWNNGGVNT